MSTQDKDFVGGQSKMAERTAICASSTNGSGPCTEDARVDLEGDLCREEAAGPDRIYALLFSTTNLPYSLSTVLRILLSTNSTPTIPAMCRWTNLRHTCGHDSRRLVTHCLVYQMQRHMCTERIVEGFQNVLTLCDGCLFGAAETQRWVETLAAASQPSDAVGLSDADRSSDAGRSSEASWPS